MRTHARSRLIRTKSLLPGWGLTLDVGENNYCGS
jgi:hypothetical protein